MERSLAASESLRITGNEKEFVNRKEMKYTNNTTYNTNSNKVVQASQHAQVIISGVGSPLRHVMCSGYMIMIFRYIGIILTL